MTHGKCTVPGCDRPVRARTVCVYDYNRLSELGMLPPLVRSNKRLDFLLATYLTPAAHDPGWPYGQTKMGYGKLAIDGRTTTAHAYVCELIHGPRPFPKAEARHSCPQTRLCFFADHLIWGTRKENAEDRLRDGTQLYGDQFPNAKLSAADVIRIRELIAEGVRVPDIALAFGVHEGTIYRIRSGKTRRHG